jgi:hypothetical protein
MTSDDLAGTMVPVACEMACLVRDQDQAGIARCLRDLATGADDEEQWERGLYALIVVLAAMVPDDQHVGDALAWLEEGTPERDAMLAKAHQRAAKRQARGLILWGPLAALELEYQRRRREQAADAQAA